MMLPGTVTRRERRALATFALFSILATTAAAQPPASPAPSPPPEPFRILDNSFLVEEAFNQEAGVVQTIFTTIHAADTWVSSVVQEWPVVSQAHQFSYSLSWASGGGDTRLVDTLLNYRYQALTEGPGRPAFSPRISAILPTAREGDGVDAFGLQFNLPFSKQTGDFYWHWNGGLTWWPAADVGDDTASLESPFLAASAIYRLAPMFHPMIEVVGTFHESPAGEATSRERSLIVSPGARGGWNIGDRQLILGFAVPVTWFSDGPRDTGAFIYASFEFPFTR